MQENIIIIASIVLGVGLPVFLLWRFFAGGVRNRRLLKTGRAAMGTIISIEQTGTYINEQPEVRFRIHVQPQGEAAFDAEAVQVVSLLQIPLIQPGQAVSVRYDPADRARVALESMGSGKVAGMNPDQIEKMLRENDEANARLNQTGTPAQAIVIKFTPIGVNVNGDNAAAEVSVKVMPEGGKPFDSVLKGIFAPTSLPRYQPGQEIAVKYNPGDTGMVAIDYSKSTMTKTT